ALAQAFERRFGPRELLGELLLGPRRSLVVQPIRGTARVLRESARLLEQTARAAARLHGSGQRQAFEVLRHGAHVLARERGGSARRTGLRAGLREIVEPLPQARGALRGLAREIFGVLGAVRLGQRALDAADLFGVLGRELLELLNELIETLIRVGGGPRSSATGTGFDGAAAPGRAERRIRTTKPRREVARRELDVQQRLARTCPANAADLALRDAAEIGPERAEPLEVGAARLEHAERGFDALQPLGAFLRPERHLRALRDFLRDVAEPLGDGGRVAIAERADAGVQREQRVLDAPPHRRGTARGVLERPRLAHRERGEPGRDAHASVRLLQDRAEAREGGTAELRLFLRARRARLFVERSEEH